MNIQADPMCSKDFSAKRYDKQHWSCGGDFIPFFFSLCLKRSPALQIRPPRFPPKMDPWTRFFWGGACRLKFIRQRWCTRPLPPFIMDGRHLQSGRRDASAQPISSADSGERSVAQRGGHGRQPGLSSGRFVAADAAIYCV